MSFRCGVCKKAVVNGQGAKRIVTHIRPKTYRTGGKGTEIVSEVLTCQKCSKKATAPVLVDA